MRYKGEQGKLWKIVSDYIRERDNWTCFTCGRQGEGSAIHAGHFIPSGVSGKNNTLNWDERNIHAQCFHCNVNLGGWGEKYTEMMELKYGKDVVECLRKRRFKVDPVKDWKSLTEEYKEKLEALSEPQNCPVTNAKSKDGESPLSKN